MKLAAAAGDTTHTSAIYEFVKQWILYLCETRPGVVTGIWSEIPEIQFVKIKNKLLRSTGHMKIAC